MKKEHALIALLTLVVIWLIILTAILVGERHYATSVVLTPPSPPPTPTPTPSLVLVEILKAEAISDTVKIELKVKCPPTIDLLYEPPILYDGQNSYNVTPKSLGEAKFALLDLVTKGEAQAKLEFTRVITISAPLTLIFNPSQSEKDALTPKVTVMVKKLEEKKK